MTKGKNSPVQLEQARLHVVTKLVVYYNGTQVLNSPTLKNKKYTACITISLEIVHMAKSRP